MRALWQPAVSSRPCDGIAWFFCMFFLAVSLLGSYVFGAPEKQANAKRKGYPMTDSSVCFATRTDAIDAALDAGFEREDVVVTRDSDSDAWTWDLRSTPGFEVALSDVGDADVGDDADADDDADAALNAALDVVSGLGTDVDVDEPALSDIDVSSGFLALAAPTAPTAPVYAHVSPDLIAMFDMAPLVAAGLVVATEPVPVPVPVSAAPVSAPVAPVSGAASLDYVIRLPGRFDEATARDMALWLAGRIGQPVEIAALVSGTVLAAVYPNSARGGMVARVPAVARGDNGLGRALAEMSARLGKPERDWATYSDSEIPESNASCRKTWKAIAEAADALDLDALAGFTFAGSQSDGTGNTYTKNNGRYLRARMVQVAAALAAIAVKRAADQAALDAEFGFSVLA